MYRCNRFEYKPPGSVILVKVYWHWITTRRVLKEWSSHIYVELNVTCERANGTSFACWASESEDILIRTVVWTRPWSSELKDWISLLMKDCVKEWTWGVKTDWMLFMISEETARRKEPKVNDWEWSELLLCKEERTNGVTELPLGSEGEWVTKRTDGLKIKTQSLCFHMKDGRSDTFRFVKRSETKRLFVNETSHKDT